MKIRTAMLGAFLLAAVATATSLMAQTVETRIPPIRTDGGLLAGKVLPSGVKAWLGVPFAKPPTGNLRWLPPQPMSWSGVWDADRIMPECIQHLRPHDINMYFGEEATSENCLYMNIWAPANATAGAKLPVIVFIYGGGGTLGSSGMPLYGGEHVAEHGAIFVNFNYRVGILGFMAHPELTKEQGGHSGDYGYLDQNAALKWVHDNIAKFGGDPSRVLVMGQSAGAQSVSLQIFSPLSKGLFQSAVMSSGCSWGGTIPTLAQGEETGLKIQKLLHASDIDEMRQVPADQILALQAEFQVMVNTPGVRTSPVIDGYFLPAGEMDILKAHKDNDVPIIASSNGDDLDANRSLLTKAKTVAEYKAAAVKMYGADAGEFLKLYPVSEDSDVSAVAHRAAEDAGMQAGSRNCAQRKAQYDKSAAYIDLFTRKQSYAPGVKIADQDPATIGAFHTADLPFWFGTLDAYNILRHTRDWTPGDRKFSDEMMGALISMAATGDPATKAVKWPAWSAANERRVVFGDHIAVEKLDTKGMDWLAAHPAAAAAIPETPGRAKPVFY